MKIKTFLNRILWVCAAVFLSLFCIFQSVLIKPANAEETTNTYTDVLEDLQKDENFNPDDYPAVANDYSLQVIQIAESVNNELFVYVYQPSDETKDFTATTINMYNGYSENGKDFYPRSYDLTLLSTNGVFDKYLVNKYVVSPVGERWYNIVSIFRFFDKETDKEIAGGTRGEVAFAVGQQWHFYYFNDVLTVEMGTFKTLDIDITYVDHLIYHNGFTMGNIAGSYAYGDSHIVCFNVSDYVIDHIYDAEVMYTSRSVADHSGILSPDDSYGEYEDHTVTLCDSDIVTFEGVGWRARTYKWNRIAKAEDFVSNLADQEFEFDDSAKNEILKSQWVFAFCETSRKTNSGTGYSSTYYTEISDVTILRLHFIDFLGNVYNLGVVADKVTPDLIPGGQGSPLKDEFDWLAEILTWIMGVCMIVALIIAIIYFCPWVISLVGKGLAFVFKWIVKILIWKIKFLLKLIRLPFAFFAGLFKKREEK